MISGYWTGIKLLILIAEGLVNEINEILMLYYFQQESLLCQQLCFTSCMAGVNDQFDLQFFYLCFQLSIVFPPAMGNLAGNSEGLKLQHWRIQVGACPPRVQILSFQHSKFSKRNWLGSQRPPTGNPASATVHDHGAPILCQVSTISVKHSRTNNDIICTQLQ